MRLACALIFRQLNEELASSTNRLRGSGSDNGPDHSRRALAEIHGAPIMPDMPPVPPENRSPKDVGSNPNLGHKPKKPDREPKPGAPENLAEQGRQGNIKQNTTNQGYQQDR